MLCASVALGCTAAGPSAQVAAAAGGLQRAGDAPAVQLNIFLPKSSSIE